MLTRHYRLFRVSTLTSMMSSPPTKQYYQDGLLHGKRKKAEVCVCVCVEGVWGVGGLGCKCGCVGVSLCTCDIRIRKWLEVGMFLEV